MTAVHDQITLILGSRYTAISAVILRFVSLHSLMIVYFGAKDAYGSLSFRFGIRIHLAARFWNTPYGAFITFKPVNLEWATTDVSRKGWKSFGVVQESGKFMSSVL